MVIWIKNSDQEVYVENVQDMETIINQLDDSVKYIGTIDIP